MGLTSCKAEQLLQPMQGKEEEKDEYENYFERGKYPI